MDNGIVFIKINEEMKKEINGFVVNPDIPLPVENPDGKEISWEMIIAAMLKLLAYNRDHEHLDYYRQFVKAVKPDLFKEMTQVAIYKAANGNYGIAEEVFLALEGLEPEDIPNLLNLARVYEEHAKASDNDEKLYDKAYETFRKALDAAPDCAEVHFYAGAFYLNQSNYIKAREHLARFIELSDECEKKEAAREIIQKLDDHDLADNFFQEAFDFIKMDKIDEGIASINKFLELHGDIWNGWFVLGWGLRKGKRYLEAKEAFLMARDKGGDSVELLNELAVCCMETDGLKEAEGYLIDAMKKEPENSTIMINYGLLSMKKGDKTNAKGFFNSALVFDPDNRYARKYIQEFGL